MYQVVPAVAGPPVPVASKPAAITQPARMALRMFPRRVLRLRNNTLSVASRKESLPVVIPMLDSQA
jgi:hypothetical protein